MKKCSIAFTLAEVLIVLTIIGIVAAMTIPAFAQNMQDQELKTAWKKQYTMLSQATMQILQENGGNINNILNQYATQGIYMYYAAYYKNIKICGESNFSCFTNYKVIKQFDGESVCSDNPLMNAMLDDGQLKFPDGASISFEASANISSDRYIFVDVNGDQNPNTIGKDIFGVRILSNKIVPLGTPGSITSPAEACFVNNTGFENSAKYLQE